MRRHEKLTDGGAAVPPIGEERPFFRVFGRVRGLADRLESVLSQLLSSSDNRFPARRGAANALRRVSVPFVVSAVRRVLGVFVAGGAILLICACENVADKPASRLPGWPSLRRLFDCGFPHRPTDGVSVRREEFSSGPIRATLTVNPAQVRFDQSILLTLSVSAPTNFSVVMPQLDDRAQGFRIAGTITPEPTSSGETRTSEVRLRLVPAVADGHRIAPIAIRYEDRSVVPPRAGWFSTRPLPLEVAPLLGGPAPRAVQADLPLRRRFSFGQPRAAALAATALVALAVALAWIAASRLGRRLQARRLSPRAQALQAIHALLRRRLPEHGRPKDFYLALTLIVRRYIEQVHTVRAPEQTTEEFLVLASHHAAFTPAVLRQLRSFLEAADLVKFAGDRPSPQAVADAVASARDYIEEDACHAPEPPERAKKSSEDGPRGRGPSRIRADAPVSRAGRDGGPAVRRFVRALAAQTPQPLSNHVHAG